MAEQPLIIRSLEDLERALVEHPEWRERLRMLLLPQELLELPARFAEGWKRLQEGLERTNEQISRLSEENTRLAQQIQQLTQRIERVEAQIEALTERMERVEAQIEVLTQRVNDLTERMERVEAQIEVLTQRVNDLTQRMERVEAQIEALTQRVNDLTQRMERVEAQIEALTQRVNDLTERMERVEAQIEALTQRVNDLTERMERVEQQIALLVHQVRRNTNDIGMLKGALEELRAFEKAAAYFGRFLRRCRPYRPYHLMEKIETALDEGRISIEERLDLLESDLIIIGRDVLSSQSVAYAVEVSWRGDRQDVERASRRAQVLGKVLAGEVDQARGAAWAILFTEGAQEAATRLQVQLLFVEPPARPWEDDIESFSNLE